MNWTLLLAGIGTGLALIGLAWNIINWVVDRHERKKPDVHGVIITPADGIAPSEIAFVNAGRGVARSVQFLYVGEEGRYVRGGHAFLLAEQADKLPLDFRVSAHRSTFVWAYMDVDGRVFTRSNYGRLVPHKKGAEVSLRQTFAAMYPDTHLPEGLDITVGE